MSNNYFLNNVVRFHCNVFLDAPVVGSDERFEEPNRKHVKLWPNILPVDDTEKEIDIYTDKIEAVSEIKTKHFDITNGSKKSAEGSDQEDSFDEKCPD